MPAPINLQKLVQFVAITNARVATAKAYLEAEEGHLDAAIAAYRGDHPAQALYDQMTDETRNAAALVLGFAIDYGSAQCAAGFRVTLRDIAPLPSGFTVGDAVRAYCLHVSSHN